VGALGQELPQPRQRLRDRVRPRDPDDIEAALVCGPGQRSF
jgi:hypothetical protein